MHVPKTGGTRRPSEGSKNMKKKEQTFSGDRFKAVLVSWEPEEKDLLVLDDPRSLQIPESYLMIGPLEGPLARISYLDAAVVQVLLTQLGHNAGYYRPMPSPRGMSMV
jgi:hypothetical protein